MYDLKKEESKLEEKKSGISKIEEKIIDSDQLRKTVKPKTTDED